MLTDRLSLAQTSKFLALFSCLRIYAAVVLERKCQAVPVFDPSCFVGGELVAEYPLVLIFVVDGRNGYSCRKGDNADDEGEEESELHGEETGWGQEL